MDGKVKRMDAPRPTGTDLRSTARSIFLETLHRLELRAVMRRKLLRDGDLLAIGSHTYDLSQYKHVVVIAVGKAATPMAEGLLELLEPLPFADTRLEGIAIGATAPAKPDARLQYRIGSHPLPDQASLEAADLVLATLRRCGPESLVFFLISGGASAMLERPLDPALPLPHLAEFYRTLVHSGLSIGAMNTLRKHLSAVKGGRLAVAAGEATVCTLLVSDVPPEMPEIIGSGLSMPDSSTVADCQVLLQGKLAEAVLSPGIRAWFTGPECPETPKPSDRAFRNASWHTLLSSDDLCQAAAAVAAKHGFEVRIDLGCDEWDYRDAAEHLLKGLDHAATAAHPVCVVSAGELSVALDRRPGTGGRNAQFALECARRIADSSTPVAVLSAGTDGIDGNSPAAGGVVDGQTLRRAAEGGLSLDRALANFDAYPLLHALGDAIHTGPSENNLRDLRLLLMQPSVE